LESKRGGEGKEFVEKFSEFKFLLREFSPGEILYPVSIHKGGLAQPEFPRKKSG